MRVRSSWVALAALPFTLGCNLITGSIDFEVESGGATSQGGESAAGGSGDGSAPGSGAGTVDGGSPNVGPGMAECGNDLCEGGEDCVTCEGDCGACAATCGNGGCDADETCVSCPGDCGTCAPACGDAVCNGSETCSDCPGDGGACPPTGPNGACDAGETCSTCSQDCGSCGPTCGDGTCDAGESCDTCASDCGACPTCGGAGDPTTTLDSEEQAFLVLINDYRASNGLGALSACTSLNRAAQGHSEDMRDQDYFSHTGLNGSSPWERSCDACYELGCGPATAMAENIAAGNSGAQATFTQWQNSPGHNANMLGSSFTQIGIGRATGGGQYGSYWTNVFGGATEPSCN